MKVNLSRFVLAAATTIAFIVAVTATARASEKVLHTFTAGKDGSGPGYGLIADAAGNLYGTTVLGGAYDAGVVFELAPTASGSWKETILYHFAGGKDGANPTSLALDSVGNLYGITQAGGRPARGTPYCQANGCGIIFRLSPGPSGWTFNLLHAFTGVNDGYYPTGITVDAAGNVFVPAYSGATNYGAIFEMVGGTKGRTIYNFSNTNLANGVFPEGPVLIDAAGNLFGIAKDGGANDWGAVYKLTPGSAGTWTESVIYSFTDGNDGYAPLGNLAIDSSGNLYGTAEYGGANQNGVVFQLTPGPGGVWTESTLHAFTGGSDGGEPLVGVTFDAEGNLYGTTQYGGNTACVLGCGVVFKLTPSSGGWSETTLDGFNGSSNGANPFFGGVILDQSGNLYGTASYGGKVSATCTFGCGVVFELPAAASGRHAAMGK